MSSRRQFIKQSSFASAALMFPPQSWFKSTQLIGIQLYTLRNEIKNDVSVPISKLADIGYNSVEVFGYGKGKFFGLSPAEFAAIFQKYNLKTPSGHYSVPNFLMKGDEDDLKKAIEDSAALKHEFFTIPYLTDKMRTSLDDYKGLAAKLNKAGELVKSAGMRLAYHNHDFEFKDWGSGQTGMDIYWTTKAGADPIALIKANKGRIKMWHLKDMDNTPAKSFTEVGSGVIQYKEIFKYQKESGMEFFFVEQDIVKIPIYDSITQSYNYVKKNLV